MQALILAAGMGKRLGALTAGNTKCMVKVCGVTLIERMLRQLEGLRLSRVVMVVGYHGRELRAFVESLGLATPIRWVDNPIYDQTNNIYSLALAKEWLLQEDTLLLESDLIFEDALLRALVEDPRHTLALVDKYESWMDGTVVQLDERDHIAAFIPGSRFDYAQRESYFKTVNIYKFSREFSRSHYVPFLEAYTNALGRNEYYEQVLRVIAMLDEPIIQAKRLDGQKWYEIDDVQDLDIAESLFAATAQERLERVNRRYGGFWRYPKLLDFCYLVNPYYPPQKLLAELHASLEQLVTQYPSGMGVNALLAGKCFGLSPAHILPGNGAAELIKALMAKLSGKVGFIRPTFEEYPNRWREGESLCFYPQGPDFAYTAQELMDFFTGKGIAALVLVNPDNPTGSYIPRAGLMALAGWARREGIRLIVDESFSDFAEEAENTLLTEETLAAFPQLVVVKSISKSYGIPGLRLGVLASGDEGLIGELKKDAAIWNINSLGEFYLQIQGKYQKQYAAALALFREAREEFLAKLKALRGLRVIPTQANYVMLELTGGVKAQELACRLLDEKRMLVKCLDKKIPGGQYLRVAVRTREENDRLVEALADYL